MYFGPSLSLTTPCVAHAPHGMVKEEDDDRSDHHARQLGTTFSTLSVVAARDFCAHRYEFAAWLSPAA